MDIDIDFSNRNSVLDIIKHIPAAIVEGELIKKHNTGVYCHRIPINPLTGTASIDYKQAEERGYFKIDFLNMNIYQDVKDNDHLTNLMNTEPLWELLKEPEFCEQLVHIGSHYKTLMQMPEPIDSIEKMAMFLSIIRPAKRYLIGKPWDEVAEKVWETESNGSYQFKKSHSIAYAHLVCVHMNLICEKLLKS